MIINIVSINIIANKIIIGIFTKTGVFVKISKTKRIHEIYIVRRLKPNDLVTFFPQLLHFSTGLWGVPKENFEYKLKVFCKQYGHLNI